MSSGIVRPAERLAILLAARKTVKRGQIVQAQPAAKLVGMSWHSFRDVLRKNPEFQTSGAVIAGAEGKAYRIDAAKMLDVFADLCRAEIEDREAKASRQAAAIGVTRGTSGGEVMSLSDMKTAVGLKRELRQEQVAQGDLVDANAMRDAAMGYNAKVQETILSAAQKADPNGRWPTEHRVMWENATRDMLIAVQIAATDWFTKMEANATRPSRA